MNDKEVVANNLINKASSWSFVLHVLKSMEINIDVMT